MDIHQLQIFANVAECKGFLAASKKMHLSQSTVSTHVSALEHELGKKLIRRTARKFELTEDGVKLYKYAVDILLLHRKAIMEVGGDGSEFLRIGTSSVPAQWFVPTILSGFLKKNVNTQVEMTSADSLDIIRRVKEGSLDIGFVGTKVEKQCKYISLVNDHLVLAAPNTKKYQKIFVGESGSGKSVTAYSLMGLTAYPGKLVGGTIDFNGHRINDLSEKEFRKIRGNEVSIIFQDPMTSLNPVYTIGNQIMEVILLHTDKNKEQARARAKELLELVGINEPEKRLKQYPHELSGGMRQRVMIAIALACEPKLLIADEPTTALDVTIQAQILELMMDLKKKLGMAIIMITHDLGVVASMCDRIAVMYAGRIVEYGTTDDIFYNPKHEYTKGLLKSIPRLDAKEHERLVPIEGTPIDLLNPPAGCPFAPRCSNCMKICLREMAPVTTFDDVHYTQCWMNQKEQMEREAAK